MKKKPNYVRKILGENVLMLDGKILPIDQVKNPVVFCIQKKRSPIERPCKVCGKPTFNKWCSEKCFNKSHLNRCKNAH